ILGVTEHGTTGNTSMIVYPNPTNESTMLQITLDTQTDVNIKVVSTLGQIVYEKQLKNKIGVIQENVDLSGMSDGVYFISVTTDKERISSKVVKQ
ncbi:MAG: T9SS type A sorting domain-containing protein, partial [Bacteroidia bacterium]